MQREREWTRQRLTEVELKWLSLSKIEKVPELCEGYPVAPTTDTMIEEEVVDTVMVATPAGKIVTQGEVTAEVAQVVAGIAKIEDTRLWRNRLYEAKSR
jgi:hypothetical protein